MPELKLEITWSLVDEKGAPMGPSMRVTSASIVDDEAEARDAGLLFGKLVRSAAEGFDEGRAGMI